MAVKPFRVTLVFGTRPEAIKLAPVAARLRAQPDRFETRIVVTAQHRDMLDQVLDQTGLRPDADLNLMRRRSTLSGLTADALRGLEPVLRRLRPQVVLVQGDTCTTLAGALAGFYLGFPVGHVEAGLRTHDPEHPFPEEVNRRMVTAASAWHFAPTAGARENLLAEGVPPRRIFVTGNPVVDALRTLTNTADAAPRTRPYAVVTAHRRESFGRPLEEICRAVADLARRRPDLDLLVPVHPNPVVRGTVRRLLPRGKIPNLKLLKPVPYLKFVPLMAHARLLITDSGGIQEEATALGVPVLIVRRNTERPEALAAGAQLVSIQKEQIITAALRALRRARPLPSPVCPFGDGRAAERIQAALEWIAGYRSRRPAPFHTRR